MLAPRKVKYRKTQKGHMRGMANSGDYVSFGSFGLKAMEPGWITSRQIEAARIAISRKVRKVGRMWIRIFLSCDLFEFFYILFFLVLTKYLPINFFSHLNKSRPLLQWFHKRYAMLWMYNQSLL